MTLRGVNGESPSRPAATATPPTTSVDPVLFGTVSAPTAASAVVGRIRAAIALGLLADGDRLPVEADLARRLGVTAFATREALSILREQGLITTRAGRNGGSIVTAGTDRVLLTQGELRRLSATDLRELGDWRQMLASVSASMAASRASTANVERLRAYADALEHAQTDSSARRAHGRFHVELAAAAQSLRMTRAEFAMYEELDWLLGLAFADSERRSEAARELAEIAAAVDARRPEAARLAAERHTASMMDALIKLRLKAIADEVGHRSDAGDEPGTVGDQLEHMLSVVHDALSALATSTEKAFAEGLDGAALRPRLARAAMAGLLNEEIELAGLGYIAEPGAIPGAEYWMAWWQRTEEGVVPADEHILDPTRDDFYDYVGHEYFSGPRASGRFSVEGPYVDYGGTNDYTCTFALPIVVSGSFVGIAAADVPAAVIERALASRLAASDESCVVINADRRVVVTNIVEHRVGDVLPAEGGWNEKAIGLVGWSVLRRDG